MEMLHPDKKKTVAAGDGRGVILGLERGCFDSIVLI